MTAAAPIPIFAGRDNPVRVAPKFPKIPAWTIAGVVAGLTGVAADAVLGVLLGMKPEEVATCSGLTTLLPVAAAQDAGPTTPSGLSPCCCCHVMVALRVPLPKFPSAVTPMIFCHAVTSAPFEPCLIVACTEVPGGTAPGTRGIFINSLSVLDSCSVVRAS